MKELLLRGARYNAWANGLFTALLRDLTDEVLDKDISSSFSSIRKTMTHLWAAEDMWLQRLQQVAQPVWQGAISGPIGEICDAWNQSSRDLVVYVDQQGDEPAFTERISYRNLSGELHHDRIDAILQHVFNHATYHRGQLVTMLRQCGVTKIPGTDLIAFERSVDSLNG